MKKHLLIVCSLCWSSISFAQNQQNKNIIEADNLSATQLEHLDDTAPKDGWVLVKYKKENYIMNFSNEDYIFKLSIKCPEAGQTPSYLIEYSRSYGDKEMGGIDFISSSRMDHAQVKFYLDGKSFGDPFSNTRDQNFTNFCQALKTAGILKIEVFDQETDPEGAKEGLKLNRAIDFKVAHGALLDTPVRCK